MKRLLTLLFTLSSVLALGQATLTTQNVGTTRTLVRVPGVLRVDSTILVPVRDTTFIPQRLGAIVFRQADLTTYQYKRTTGQKWEPLGSGGAVNITGETVADALAPQLDPNYFTYNDAGNLVTVGPELVTFGDIDTLFVVKSPLRFFVNPSEAVNAYDTLAINQASATDSGYITPAMFTRYEAAANDRPTALAFSGTTTKTLTLTQGDGTTLTATFTDDNSGGGGGGLTINGNFDNRLLTANGTTTSIDAEGGILWDGSVMTINGRQDVARGRSGQYTFIGRHYISDMAGSSGTPDFLEFSFGKTENTNQRASLFFKHVGDFSGDNGIGFFFPGTPERMRIEADGDFFIPQLAATSADEYMGITTSGQLKRMPTPSGTTYTFANSLTNSGGTVTLTGDAATPGASKYYGTDGSGVRGFYTLPSGGSATPGGSTGQLQVNNAGAFGGLSGSAFSGSEVRLGSIADQGAYTLQSAGGSFIQGTYSSLDAVPVIFRGSGGTMQMELSSTGHKWQWATGYDAPDLEIFYSTAAGPYNTAARWRLDSDGNIQSPGWRRASYFQTTEIAAPATPGSGFGAIYTKTDGLLYFKNDGGTEYLISGASGGITGATNVGTGEATVYTSVSGSNIQLRSFSGVADRGILFATNGNLVTAAVDAFDIFDKVYPTLLNTTATTTLKSITPPVTSAGTVRVTVSGISADGTTSYHASKIYSYRKNASGTVSIVGGTPAEETGTTSDGLTGSMNVVASGANILIQVTPGTSGAWWTVSYAVNYTQPAI